MGTTRLRHSSLNELLDKSKLDAKAVEVLQSKGNCQSCFDRMLLMMKRGSEETKKDDMENAYIYYYRASEIGNILTKRAGFEHYPKKSQVYTVFTNALNYAEQLHKSLRERYEQEAAIPRALTAPSNGLTLPILPASSDKKLSDYVGQAKISPKELVRALQNTQPAKSALIVDFRDTRDKVIHYDKANYITVAYVPANYIKPGLIFNGLTPLLPVSDRSALMQITKYDLIVLMEESDPEYRENGELLPSAKAFTLLNALYTYNQAYKPKHKPIIMEGGFENWLRHYPVYTQEINKEPVNELSADFEQLVVKIFEDNYGVKMEPLPTPIGEGSNIESKENLPPAKYPSLPSLDKRFEDVPKNPNFFNPRNHVKNVHTRLEKKDEIQPANGDNFPQVPSRDSKPDFKPEVPKPPQGPITTLPAIDRSKKPQDIVLGGYREGTSVEVPPSSFNATAAPTLDRSKKPYGINKGSDLESYLIGLRDKIIDALEQDFLTRNEKPGQVGIYNMGNTCFVNATLQCLVQTPFLSHYFSKDNFLDYVAPKTRLNTGGQMAAVFSGLMDVFWGGRVKQIRPACFMLFFSKINPYFSDRAQHDAQEFEINLLDALHEDTNRVTNPVPLETNYKGKSRIVQESKDYIERARKYADSPISNLFDTLRVYELNCCVCSESSVNFEKWRMLSLEIRPRLEDCFSAHFRDEKLDGDERWECPRCQCKRPAIRTARIWSLPPVLIIHLMRFSVTDGGYMKNSDPVHFERTLDVSRWVHPASDEARKRYVLYAVTNHRGSLNSGHYTAITQHKKDQSWVRYDDETAVVTSSSAFNASDAFILYYKKEDIPNQ